MGFTYHLCQRFQEAIEYYHRALGIDPHLTFCSEMLSIALDDFFQFDSLSVMSATAAGAATTSSSAASAKAFV
jgi:tetratricopeptide (TPR) repeat protein